MKCDHCGKTGHLKENCYQFIGYPIDFKAKRKATVAQLEGNRMPANTPARPTPLPAAPTQMFTQEQVAQILQTLNRTIIGNDASAHMAGFLV
nr:uncharacterized protein LOC117281610 isoform X2 [Nicotiana tomentosiformis]